MQQQAGHAESMAHHLMLGPFKVRAIACGTAYTDSMCFAGLLAVWQWWQRCGGDCVCVKASKCVYATSTHPQRHLSTICCPHIF